MSFLSINTERLQLRALEPDDAESVFGYRSDSNVSRYQSWEPENISEVRALIARQNNIKPNTAGTWYQLAVCLRHNASLIGDCGLHFPESTTRDAEIGITISPDHQGNGYAVEALRAVFAYLFEVLAKLTVYGAVDPRNRSSMRLLERAGMQKEADAGKSPWYTGDWDGDIVYALQAADWHKGATS